MRPSELKAKLDSINDPFFNAKIMAIWGDTMRNFRCRDGGDCWELYRAAPVKHNLNDSYFFNKITFKRDRAREARVNNA